MSSSLVWEPRNRKTNDLCTGTKFLFREMGNGTASMILGGDDLMWLRALAVGRDEAVKSDIITLIEAIREHGEISLTEVY